MFWVFDCADRIEEVGDWGNHSAVVGRRRRSMVGEASGYFRAFSMFGQGGVVCSGNKIGL